MDRTEFRKFVPFAKVDPVKRIVAGYASTETVDSDGEIVEKAAMEEAMPEYMSLPGGGNLRSMHQPIATGKVKAAVHDEQGTYIEAKVVDDGEWKKVVEQVYTGFSIGGKKLRQAGKRIKALRLSEISLVDRPANPQAVFSLVKFDKVAQREDVSPADKERAQREYGNVTYADAKNKKYPLDSEAHVRAAWSYINMPANAAKYSPADVATMKRAIMAAGKAMGIGMSAKFAKALEDPLVRVMDAVCLPSKEGGEMEKEDKTTDTTDEVKDDEKDEEDTTEEVKEDTAEEVKELSAKLDDLAKRLDPPKAEENPDIAKMADVLTKIVDRFDSIDERLTKVEAQPAPVKVKAVTVSKSEDTDEDAELDKVQARLDELTEIRETDLEKFDGTLQREARRLLAKKDELIRKAE